MALSLVVLLIPVAVMVALFRLKGGERMVTVDPQPALSQARAHGAFSVAEPTGLTEGWATVSAEFQTKPQGATLRIGYVTPTGGALQLIQSSEPFDALVARELGDRRQPAGSVTHNGLVWQDFSVRKGERALVASPPGRTLIVIGRAEAAEIEALAAAVS